ncbi:hypothetical protein EDD22DRAFT_932849 [Suillus occidentalis]|nr:hypothetical protein EDD22DRAFT_932849 [Suillus occidentalis]
MITRLVGSMRLALLLLRLNFATSLHLHLQCIAINIGAMLLKIAARTNCRRVRVGHASHVCHRGCDRGLRIVSK